MTAISVDYQFNDTEIIAALQRLAGSGANLSSPFGAIGESLMESTKHRFETTTSPEGESWSLNSGLSTLLNVDKKCDRALTGESGLLMDTMNYQLNAEGVEIGSPMEYAAMQQFGGTKSEFPHLWGDIPARPFLGISADDEKMIIDTLHDHFELAMR